jgi:alanine-alpha-ketoisovalerate/valine-pyruvate aminotransferase
MNETFSEAGGRLAARSGILDLMDDLGRALTTDPGMRMLGGGNPAHIGAVDAVWRRRMGELMADGDALERMLGNYDPPRGNPVFLEVLAGFNPPPESVPINALMPMPGTPMADHSQVDVFDLVRLIAVMWTKLTR